MSKYPVERPGHLAEVERVDEQTRVPDLPAAAAAHEAPKLLLASPSLPRRLFLEGAEGSEVTLGVDDPFHGGGTERANQLVLQICHADVETEPFHVDASEAGAEARPFETAPEVALLCCVAESGEADVEALRAEQVQEASYGLRTADRHDRNALGAKIPATAPSERLERDLVADPFNEHDGTRLDTRVMHRGVSRTSGGRRARR